MNVTLTDNAYEHLRNLRTQHNKKYIRLAVKGGGCAGFEYKWSFDDNEQREDAIIDDVLLIDRMFELYMNNIEIDYNSEIFGSAFSFNNPMAKSSCGCGTSFSV
tara:strand:+ start:340 stop:651 length:312 start_codon:yes stop_codon:yes gene_type:complete